MFDTGTVIGNFNDVSLHGGVAVHFDCHLLCEAGPLALIIEQLGGRAVDASGRRILDLTLDGETDVHKTCTLIAGSPSAIETIATELAATAVDTSADM
jgi:fructose-1,6-bisphosphatase